MYLTNKTFHPVNFTFAKGCTGGELLVGTHGMALHAEGTADDVYHVRIEDTKRWPRDYCQSDLTPLKNASTACTGARSRLTIGKKGELILTDHKGKALLSSPAGKAFGVCGTAWVFQFEQTKNMQFYGMGEKSTPFEKSGRTHRFWNTDSHADFHWDQLASGHYDPDYIAIPYVIIKQGHSYTGVLVDNPFATAISVPRTRAKDPDGPLFLGSEDGVPSLYLIHGPSLPELTRKFQSLTGRTPLPPLWALGYHQCRWGYAGDKDLNWLADNFEKHRFPADGLWLDIDYMDGYRVFTTNRKHLPSPQKTTKALHARGFRVLPILDPGVKQEKGFAVYDDGRRAGAFCRNDEGTEFVGIVWPGHTVFPDFSQDKARAWWAEYVRRFANTGFGGAWLDMNDPSTGPIECVGMRFDDGNASHGAYHNQYAMLMARATREGFLKANPGKRPFLLSRSGFTGSQKYAANWSGDIFNNYHHLHMSIGKSINLALSGIVFNGPDIGGFFGNTEEDLMLDWMKAFFLFPFCRNHTVAMSRQQEPWEYSRKALTILRHYARLRYKLLPWLYNLFACHEETGEAILRPLFYDFRDSPRLPLGTVDDQFMMGPDILQAPFVREGENTRVVVLPATRWYRADTGTWLAGGRKIRATKSVETTPLFIRDGAIIPMQKGVCTTNKKDMVNLELFLCVSRQHRGTAKTEYVADDGESFEYLQGGRSRYTIQERRTGSVLHLKVQTVTQDFGVVQFTPVTPVGFSEVVVERDGEETVLHPHAELVNVFGAKTRMWYWR